MAHGSSMDLSLPVVRETSQSLFLKIWPPKTRGYAVKNHQLRDTNELLKAASAFSPHDQAHNVKK